MAKVGEGDPRWIVENREDGHNVNGWHWSEKDCLPWSKNVISGLFDKKVIQETDEYTFKISSTPVVSGECTANNRKGKTIFLYELDVKMNWEVVFKAKKGLPPAPKSKASADDIDEDDKPSEPITTQKKTISGEFKVPYIADENGEEAPTVRYSVNTTADNDETKQSINMVSALLKSHGVPFVQSQCQEFVKLLKKEFISKKQAEQNTTTTTTTNNSSTTTAAPQKVTSSTVINTTSPTPAKKSNTKTLRLKEEFQCSPMDAYDVFVNVNKLRAFTQSDCIFENEEGGKFSLYGGSIQGVNKTLSPGSKIVQSWRLDGWSKGVESQVTITFSVDGKPLTNVEIVQTGIPTDEFEKTEEGWKRNILDRIKHTFSYSSKIF
ncbi:hypothetical protein RB653_006977 [Dictyostelium firmibasis]|uniref:Activator of Hsp90 ATPase AHSA1-like N-terminal domain-containing protein n=1 Tax=Dictyostelium firmibasis TaxID=79012 RepID=A0AAN7TUY6_9MYCE